ncbi:unnamed protein product [Leptidea sinapis]|uniref:Uncharacterized protein n=1 Tax=Leptidea sinapis TaxID=189913 RepID=A0A5E4QPU5_9NEOP|nr:unnamed protein product [Leptidea sinapis]
MGSLLTFVQNTKINRRSESALNSPTEPDRSSYEVSGASASASNMETITTYSRGTSHATAARKGGATEDAIKPATPLRIPFGA